MGFGFFVVGFFVVGFLVVGFGVTTLDAGFTGLLCGFFVGCGCLGLNIAAGFAGGFAFATGSDDSGGLQKQNTQN